MLNKYFIVILLLMLAGSAHGQEFCIRPVPGGELVSDTENERTISVGYSNIIAGYKGVVLNTTDYKKLIHFNGQEFSEIKDDFPQISGFAYKHIYTDLNGNSYGVGSKPKGIFYLPKGGEKWQAVNDPKDFKTVRFDKGNGSLYFSRDGAWEQMLNGKVIGKVDMPDDKTSYIHTIRSVPELSGVFALERPIASKEDRQSNQSLWFKAEGGDWQKIDIPVRDKFNVLIDLNKSTFEVSGKLIRIFRGSRRAPLFLSKTSQGLKFLGASPAAYWRQHTESGSWIAWIGETHQRLEKLERVSMFRRKKRPNKLIPPKLFLLRSGTTLAEEITGVEPHSIKSKLNMSYTDSSSKAFGFEFIRAETGYVVYDGTHFSQPEALLYTNIGTLVNIKDFNEDAFIQSEKGVFRLLSGLAVRRIETFPIEKPIGLFVDINYFKQAGQYLISDRKNDTFFTSPDMKTFTKLENEGIFNRIIAVLQDPPTALFSVKGGSLMVTQNCPDSE